MENSKSCIVLTDRTNLRISGVLGVNNLTETDVCVIVGNDLLLIHGENLKAEKLSVETGELIINGIIASIKFENKKEKQSLLKRIFK